MRKVHILVLAPNLPAAAGMPGSPRLFSLCRELSRTHRLSLMSFNTSEERAALFQKHAAPSGVFTDFTLLPDIPEATTRWRRLRHQLHLASHFLTAYRHPEFHRAICEAVRTKCAGPPAVDLVYVDTLQMTQYATDIRHLPAVVDLHDSLTLLSKRSAQMEPNARRRLWKSLMARSVTRLEKSVLRRFGTVITNSEVDAAVLRGIAPRGARVVTLQNGVDAEYFCAESVIGHGGGNRAVFVGVMSYSPNHDAAMHFAREIFPRIRAAVPTFESFLVGHGAPDDLVNLGIPGVHVTGSVPDVRPFLASAPVFVCPLRYGSGMKNKVLAAMAMARAVVATPVSVEGIEARDGDHFLVANDPEAFAAKVTHLLQHPDEARALGERARKLVLERYAWTARGASLEQVVGSLVNGTRP